MIKTADEIGMERAAEAAVAEARLEDEAGERAAAEPLPGPSRKAFSAEQSISVGEYEVRAACDYDVELLSEMSSKFYDFFMKGDGRDDILPSGPDAWELCWIMTRPAESVALLVESQKVAGLKAAAKKEFAFLQTRDLGLLVVAAVRQIVSSCQTIVGHKPAESGTEEANGKPNPPRTGPTRTA